MKTMAEQTKYEVSERIKIRGVWRDPGDKVLLDDDERAAYAHALEGEDGPYSTTQVPPPGYDAESYQTRPMTPTQRPLKEAQKEADTPEAMRPDDGRGAPQEPVSRQGQEATRPGGAETQESDTEPLAEQEPVEPENPSSKGSLAEEGSAEQTTEDVSLAEEALADEVPYYSYLEKDGTYTTREEIAAATDEDLAGVKNLSDKRVAEIREVIPHSGS